VEEDMVELEDIVEVIPEVEDVPFTHEYWVYPAPIIVQPPHWLDVVDPIILLQAASMYIVVDTVPDIESNEQV
jgi:hypothetical protein